jgi:Major capsid protein Gp23
MESLLEFKNLLKESYDYVSTQHGAHPVKDGPQVYNDQASFDSLVDSLAQGLEPKTESLFRGAAKNIRKLILEASFAATTYTPYNFLLLPLLRIFFPRLVAKEVVTVDIMERPFIVKYFLHALAVDTSGNSLGQLPDYTGAFSSGPSVASTQTLSLSSGKYTGNLITVAGVTGTTTGIQDNLQLVSATDGTDTVQLAFNPNSLATHSGVTPNIDNITSIGVVTVTYPTTGNVDRLYVECNIYTGAIQIIATPSGSGTGAGSTTSVKVQYSISLEGNQQSNQIQLSLDPIQITAISRKLNVQWSIELEQDVRALFDIDAQAEMLDLVGAQVAVDIDREILYDLMNSATVLNAANATDSTAYPNYFYKTPQGLFSLGVKLWYETIITNINAVSAKVYQDTAIAPANIIVCNPVDLAILQSTGEYSKTGDLTGGTYVGTTPYKIGELSNQYKTLATQIMPQGKMLIMLKPDDPKAAVYTYMPYQPVTIYPWPMGNVPSLTFMSRYGKKILRPTGIGMLFLH